MSILKPVRVLGAVAILATVPLIVANAQTQPPAPSEPVVPRAASKPETAPLPQTPPAQKPTITPRTEKSVTAPAKAHPLIGRAVFSADGNKLGSVNSVATGSDGKVAAIHIKTGSFLGFGGKLVAIPEGKFTQNGEYVQLGMSAEEVSKLPDVKGQT
jgi:PRC-barrel domain